MTTNPQGQRSWNTFQSQSVAGRPYPPGKCTLQTSGVEPTVCKPDSHMWLMRTPSGCSPNSYARSSVDSIGLRSTYARDASYGSHPFIVDGDFDIEDTSMSSTRDICDYLIHLSSTSSLIADVDDDDFDDSDSETDVDSDSDSEAQYITISPGSPWWKAPPSSHSVSFDTLVDEDDVDLEDPGSDDSLSQALQQQQLLVGFFQDELRRIIPGDHPHVDDWLKEVDAKLLLEPVESFEEACRRSMAPASRALSDFGSKPRPDVPVDLDDAEDGDDDSTAAWEWEYPYFTHRS